MENGIHGTVKLTILDQLQELVLVQIVGNFAVGEVLELVRLAQVIDRDNVLYAAIIQRLDQIGTDKSAGSGDNVIAHENSRLLNA